MTTPDGERPDPPPGAREPGFRRRGGPPFWRRHRRPLVALATVTVVVVAVLGGYAYWIDNRLDSVPKVDTSALTQTTDPDEGRALNILLLGSDKGEKVPGDTGGTLAEDAAASRWPAGKYRSDTLIIAHIAADRRSVQLVSIPRDTFTTIYDADGRPHGEQKINAAFSEYGPNGAISTVEKLTNVPIDHLAIIDWAGFKDLSEAVGGVPVYIPRSFYDPKQKISWQAGRQTLEGDKALAYVRTRYGLVRGDFDRIARQQNFLRAMMGKMLSKGVTRNPVRLTRTLTAVTSNLTIDEGWSAADLRALALSLRGVTARDVTFLTAPLGEERTDPTAGAVVVLDPTASASLWRSLRLDRVRDYARARPQDRLADAEDVG